MKNHLSVPSVSFESIESIELKDNNLLRDYQVEITDKGLKILKELGLLYLAMEVRTGKTLTSLAIANRYGAQKVLFITKKKAIPSVERDFSTLSPSFEILVTNYEQLHKIDADEYDFVIVDEAHCLGQFPKIPARVKLVKKACAQKPVIFLSGTPTPESFSQIYHQLFVSSCSPFYKYPNFYSWAKEYVDIKQRRIPFIVNDYSDAKREMIMSAIEPFFITYTQRQAGFTQMVKEHVLPVTMNAATYNLAMQLKAERIYIGKHGEKVEADTAVKLMQKLHQVYSGSVISDNNQEPIPFDDSKARFIASYFKGKKIAIFYKFKAEASMLRAVLGGKVTESPEEFAERNDLTFISQIQSGREGINLSTADCLVFFNIDFSHVSYLQSRARLQTKDREKACELFWVFSKGGIEEKIYQRVQSKQDYQVSYFQKDFKLKPVKRVA